MGIVYVECCERKHHCCCDCCDDKRDRCPNPVFWNESPVCAGLRAALAARGEVTVGALGFRFFNQPIRYSSTLCAGVYRTPTVMELQQIASSLTASPGGASLCPMLVWATNMLGDPVLVRVYPANGTIGEVTNPPTWRCRAYSICVRDLPT